MPVDFPVYEGGDSRRALGAFVIAARDFLAELIETNRDPRGQSLFHEELLLEMRAAWAEAYPEFERVARATRELGEAQIRDHGLYGAQLRFKLTVVRFLYGRYLQLGGIGPLRRVIDAIDTLLKSILGALGAGEGIKEIKEYIEYSLED
ncbi:MAG TPA: hypothetical protein VKY65_17410 [Alphaproteobacteria bacterium]|nr:hypothetical protein [Alphaproteobacteria bacterium]